MVRIFLCEFAKKHVPDLWTVKANYHAVPDIQYEILTNIFILSMKILYRKMSVYS